MAIPKRLVLDTDIIIDHLRGKSANSLVSQLQDECALATTQINSFELYYGTYKSKNVRINLASVKGFLSTVAILEFDEPSAEKSGQVMAQLEVKGQSIDPRDLFIGCISLAHGYPLLTKNQRHLDRIPELLVLTPRDLDSTDADKRGVR
jgi:tRNA(fMet)-specific endonuclease VapC